MEQWEFMTASLDPSNPLPRLNELGAEGWELAAATEGSEGIGAGDRKALTAFMKRVAHVSVPG